METETRKRAHREVNQGKLLGSLSWEALFRLGPRGGSQAGGAAVPNPTVGCPGLCKSPDAKWRERLKQGTRPGTHSKRGGHMAEGLAHGLGFSLRAVLRGSEEEMFLL